MNAEQVRAARAMLRMEQAELSDLAGVSTQTIKRIEAMDGQIQGVRPDTMQAIELVFLKRGVWFVDELSGSGVMMSDNITLEDAVFEDLPLLFYKSKNWLRVRSLDDNDPDFEGVDSQDRYILVQCRTLTAQNKDQLLANASRMMFSTQEIDARYALVLEGFPMRLMTSENVEMVGYSLNNRPQKPDVPIGSDKPRRRRSIRPC